MSQQSLSAVVSLLDDKHNRLIEDLWAELDERFGLRNPYESPYPHFTYQVAEFYDQPALEAVLHKYTENSSHFTVQTSGLGIFTGPQPALYVPVARNTHLTRLHQAIWPGLSSAASGVSDYYHPSNWLPHITLLGHNLDPARLSQVVKAFSQRHFDWEITVNNLALIHESGGKQELLHLFEW